MSVQPSTPNPAPHEHRSKAAEATHSPSGCYELSYLLNNCVSAEVLVRSDDPSLKAGNIPDIFSGLAEGKQIWELCRTPTIDPAQILARQNCIQQLAHAEQLDAINEAKRSGQQLASQIAELFQETSIHPGKHTSVLSLYHSRQRMPANERERIERVVNEIMRGIAQARDGIVNFQRLLRGIDLPGPVTLASELDSFQEFLDFLSADDFLDEVGVNHLGQHAGPIVECLTRCGVFTEMAGFVSAGALCCCTFNAEQEPGYSEGWSVLCPETQDHRNNSPRESLVTCYASVNKSGKSETGLKQPLAIQLVGQAFGHTSAAKANIWIRAGLFYLDRPTSDYENELSAFTREATNHATAYGISTDAILGFVDEGWSSTSPTEGNQFWQGCIQYCIDQSIRVHGSTHHHKSIEFALEHPDIVVYELPVTFDDAGEPTYSYQLQEVTDAVPDSESFKIAACVGYPREILDRAESHKLGLDLDRPATTRTTWANVTPWSETQRSEFKTEAAHARGQFPQAASLQERHFMLLSQNKRFERAPFYLGIDGKLKSLHIRHGEWHFHPRLDSNFLYQVLLGGPTITPQETMERQRMMQSFMANSPTESFYRQQIDLAYIEHALIIIDSEPHIFLDAIHHLNPFTSENADRLNDPIATASLVIDYLVVCQGILGSKFAHSELLADCRELLAISREVRNSLDSITVDETNQLQRDWGSAEVPEGRVLEIYREFRKDFGAPRGEVPPVTYREIFSYIGRQRDNPTSTYYSWSQRPEYDIMMAAVYCLFSSPLDASEYTRGTGHYPPAVTEGSLTFGEMTRIQEENWSIDSDDFFYNNFHRQFEHHCFAMPIRSTALHSRVAAILDKFGYERPVASYSNLREAGNSLFDFVRSKLPSQMPIAPLYGVEVEKLAEPLGRITARTLSRVGYNEGDKPQYWQSPNKMAIAVKLLADPVNQLQRLLEELRSHDSIACHRSANAIAASCETICVPTAKMFTEDLGCHEPPIDTEKAKQIWQFYEEPLRLICPEEDLPPAGEIPEPEKLLALLDSIKINDFRKPYRHLATLYQREAKTALEPLHELSEKVAKLYTDFEWAACKYEREDTLRSVDDENREEVGRFIQQQDALRDEARRLLEGFDSWVDPQKSLEQLMHELEHRYYAQFDTSARRVVYTQHSIESVFRKIQDDLVVFSSLGVVSDYLRDNPIWQAGRFSADGMLAVSGLVNPYDIHRSQPQSIGFEPSSFFRCLESPHASGKSHFQIGLSFGLATFGSIGFAPGQIISPPLSGVVYMDRITSKLDRTQSGMTSDILRHIEVVKRARGGGVLCVNLDEPATTMPPLYQADFTFAVVEELYRLGHYGTVSGHIHETFAAIAERFPEISQVHFGYTRDADGKIVFTREITEGPAPSLAFELAQQEGLQPEVLEYIRAAAG